ncbi:amidohydrolase [Oceanicola sp. 22II-s10i]|uniref:M20 aminoacylase family protein n=1 Tax=Oceanicola sp. 22II-s10i TaxID=1317116 RepID=UPI000B525E8A|nr:M20 aminoacylase family protein [Oceanicola sp. 22II-s10i]OWU83703.1 amidohydrolase [Oceanicola sp. 22II-s10i]
MPIRNRIAEMQGEIAEWRQDFHRHPELLYEVHRTAGIVAQKLREFGCDEVVEGIGRTGVVATIKGRTDTSGRVIGLRADMDALPINEASGVAYASETPGMMHACGHDGHTAILLGAAKYLAETRNFDGTAVLIFQPAEEGGAGGLAMCEDGMLDRWNVQEVYGLHNAPGLPVGTFSMRKGATMASADQFDIVVRGKGGHAARPHLAIDPVVAAGHLIVALQSIASRNIDPVKEVVVSICTLRADSATHNVIPMSVQLRGTIRTLDPDVRDQVEPRVRAIVEHTCAAFGAVGELEYERGYPVLVNHDDNVDFAADAALAVSAEVDRNAPARLGGEDFAYLLERRPGAYISLGNGDSAPLHHPEYNFNDDAIPAGCSWFAEMVERRMPAA